MVTAAAMGYAMEFALADGTVVSGEIEGDISVRASFGTFSLSGEAIVSIELGDPAKIELEDGSTIVAQILGDTLSVRWAYGVVELAIADIASVGGVRSAGGGGQVANRQYLVGENGPAGGIVFYDKGEYSDGWRYLEAWISDEAGAYQWKMSNTNTGGTSTSIGSGYANTYTAMAGPEHPPALCAMRKAPYFVEEGGS